MVVLSSKAIMQDIDIKFGEPVLEIKLLTIFYGLVKPAVEMM
jgi:hypothetical protein